MEYFRLVLDHLASIFEWHKRFKDVNESVRDDKMCERSKEVRTPELIGQIKNFMDQDLLYTYISIHGEIYIYILDTYRCNDKDARRIKTQEDFFNNIFTSHFICKGWEKGYWRFACERELKTEHNWNILTPKLWPLALCLSRSPGLLNWRSILLGDGFLYCILSATFLVPKLHRGSRVPPRPGVAFSTTSPLKLSATPLNWPVELNWVI